MATLTGKAVSELTAASSIADSDLFAISSSGASKKATAEVLRGSIVRQKLYTIVAQLGLTYQSTTIAAAYAAMPTNSTGIFVSPSFTDSFPQAGTVVMTKSAWDTNGYILLYSGGTSSDATAYNIYFMPIYGNNSIGYTTGTWRKILFESDSGWLSATLASSFKAYSDESSNAPQYRKIGDTVYLRGVVAPTSAIASNAGSVTMLTLPSGYRPTKSQQFICQGSLKNTWLMTVNVGGTVAFSRYGVTAQAECEVNAWLPFDVQFPIN